jgi:hypothetical protein
MTARRYSADLGHPDAVPEIVVTGVTRLVGRDNEIEDQDAIVLRTVYEGIGLTLFLATYTDVWLTHDIAGNPQQDVHCQNYPRLRYALERLSEALCTEVQPSDPTKYAIPSRVGLDRLS